MTTTIHFYGERGLVNTMFLDLRKTNQTLKFLRKIKFPFEKSPTVDVSDDVDVRVFIEVGFAEFGWPDAIVSLDSSDGKRTVLFFEAKAGCYIQSAKDFTRYHLARGFNSTINGQLTLRFRLGEALRHHKAGSKNMTEPRALSLAYGSMKPLKLNKSANLKNIVEPFLAASGNENDTKYLFVVLTTDKACFWRKVEEQYPRLLPYVRDPARNRKIEDLDSSWTDKSNDWSTVRERFGWIGFDTFEGLVPGGEFFSLAKGFLDARRDRPAAGARPERGKEYEYRKPDGTTIRVRVLSPGNTNSQVSDSRLSDPQKVPNSALKRTANETLEMVVGPETDKSYMYEEQEVKVLKVGLVNSRVERSDGSKPLALNNRLRPIGDQAHGAK